MGATLCRPGICQSTLQLPRNVVWMFQATLSDNPWADLLIIHILLNHSMPWPVITKLGMALVMQDITLFAASTVLHCVSMNIMKASHCPKIDLEVFLLRMLLLFADVNNKKTLDFLASLR